LYNNETVAWEVSERNDLDLVLSTVKQFGEGDAILHSDQGFQYTMKSDAKLLQDLGLIEYIHFYITERFQKKLGDLSPVEYRESIAV